MIKKIDNISIIKKQIKRFFENNFGKIIEINEKYSRPKIEMTPIAKFSFILLKFYLLFMIILLFYKFITFTR